MKLFLIVYAVLLPFNVLATIFVWRVRYGPPYRRVLKVAAIWLVPWLGLLASCVLTAIHVRGAGGSHAGGDSAVGYAGDTGSSGGEGGGSDSGCSDSGVGGGDSSCH
ncbi:MAG: hypothetical protein ACREPC_09445 [Stenotrophomonas sp.]|uniref:hypothetical protein n=1 Tax=Stenotrophomonas sp. TaxID=69392 RepID=UPI003D6D1A05